jgi:transposase
MKQAENGLVSLLFLDASHFVMGCDFLGYVYGKARRFVKTFSGRKRYNVLGALDFVSKKITTVTNDTYITATEICEMLRKISRNYADKTVHVILDNARYQKCAVVQELAKELGIRLIFIPPYSPNLNLIERLWKFTKSKLRSRYYNQFDIFQETIDSIIDNTHTFYKDAINQLIGKKIQLFDDLVTVTENSFRRNPHAPNIRQVA